MPSRRGELSFPFFFFYSGIRDIEKWTIDIIEEKESISLRNMRKFDARDKYTIFKTIGIDEKYIQKEEIWYMEWFRFVMI